MTSHTLPRDSTAFDFIESLGGRDRYIERMREHGRRLAQLREAQQRRPSQLTTTRDVEGLRRTAPAPPPPRSGVDNQWAPGTSPQELSRRLSENRQRRDESLEAHARRRMHMERRIARQASRLSMQQMRPPYQMRASAPLPPELVWREVAARRAQRTAELARREPLLPESRRGSTAAGVARRGVGGGAAARAEEAASGGRGALLLETLLRQIVEQRLFREAELRPFLSRAERDLAGVEDSETLADVFADVRAAFFL